jgi:hypothetical protein
MVLFDGKAYHTTFWPRVEVDALPELNRLALD